MKKRKHDDQPWVVTFNPEDSVEEKLKKAAHVKPSPAQIAWMEKEFVAFIHFGPNTFNGLQWGCGKESISDYQPSALDVSQWCNVCAKAGMKMMVFTAKHHDGFCQWHTQTTDFSVKHSLVSEDIMEQLRRGCESNGIELGVYLSPWDMHQRELNLWGTEKYNEYFLSQLKELLTHYGQISEVWFDGACSDFEIWKAVPTYKPQKWYDMIETLQPSAVVRLYDPYNFATEDKWKDINTGNAKLMWNGKGVRWVGNEGGTSRQDEWSVQPVNERQIAENATWKDLGEEKYYESAVGAIWYPLEVNTVILNQWFWNDKTSHVRSLPDLVEVYYNSIGNNGVLLLNLSPNTHGVIGREQIDRLMQLKSYVDNTFSYNLVKDADLYASEEEYEHMVRNATDGNKMTFWTTKELWKLESSTASLTIDFNCEKTFDNVLLQEFVREGQRVAKWSLEVWENGGWQEVVRHKTIGYKNIKRFKAVTTTRVRFNILRSWDKPMISNFGLYLSDILPETDEKVSISEVIRKPSAMDTNTLQRGLKYCCYEGGLQCAALLDSVFAVKLLKTGITDKIDVKCAGIDIGYSLSYMGYLKIPFNDAYTFQLESTDGSVLYLGESLLLCNDEPHDLKSVTQTLYLEAGYYSIKVFYTSFRNSGNIRVSWKRSDDLLQEIDSEYLFNEISQLLQ